VSSSSRWRRSPGNHWRKRREDLLVRIEVAAAADVDGVLLAGVGVIEDDHMGVAEFGLLLKTVL